MEWLPGAQSPCQNKYFGSTSRESPEKARLSYSRGALFYMETRVSLRSIVTACS